MRGRGVVTEGVDVAVVDDDVVTEGVEVVEDDSVVESEGLADIELDADDERVELELRLELGEAGVVELVGEGDEEAVVLGDSLLLHAARPPVGDGVALGVGLGMFAKLQACVVPSRQV